ncbi:kinase-like domain-containing protein [Vararia minispora EC-137]|uniref:Kinase-like domain-containing protein n=1 Tax=Vararia minispora EC-137 TaxID=1314806 RepID=A0ACB8QUQ7_9AGAM|nr:kinase-like domain-containing protein [Vararia minispora EC-137]
MQFSLGDMRAPLPREHPCPSEDGPDYALPSNCRIRPRPATPSSESSYGSMAEARIWDNPFADLESTGKDSLSASYESLTTSSYTSSWASLDDAFERNQTIVTDGKRAYTLLGRSGPANFHLAVVTPLVSLADSLDSVVLRDGESEPGFPRIVTIGAVPRHTLETNRTIWTQLEQEMDYLRRIGAMQPPSPFLLKVLSSFYDTRNVYFATAVCVVSFHDLLADAKMPLRTIDVVFFAAELLLAIEHLRKIGVVHSDITLRNIFIGLDGHLVLGKLTSLLSSEPVPTSRKNFPPHSQIEWDLWSYGKVLLDLFIMACEAPLKGYIGAQECSSLGLLEGLGVEAVGTNLDERGRDLVKQLLQPDPFERLSIKEIKSHELFANFDWAACEAKELCPPYRPAHPDLYTLLEPNLIPGEPVGAAQRVPELEQSFVFPLP